MRVRIRSLLGSVALLIAGCCLDPKQIVDNYPEGLVAGARNLACVTWDYDSTTLRYRYQLANRADARDTLALIRQQVARSQYKRDVLPPIGCFRVLEESGSHFLMQCDDAAHSGPIAWHVRIGAPGITDVDVTVGDPRVVRLMVSEARSSAP